MSARPPIAAQSGHARMSGLGPEADIHLLHIASRRWNLFVVFDAGLKKFQETPPRIDAGLGISLRCTTHTEQTTGHALNLQPERTRGSRSARHEDEMSRAFVFQMAERIGVMMHLKPAHCDVGERRRWPHLIAVPETSRIGPRVFSTGIVARSTARASRS